MRRPQWRHCYHVGLDVDLEIPNVLDIFIAGSRIMASIGSHSAARASVPKRLFVAGSGVLKQGLGMLGRIAAALDQGIGAP